MKNICKIALKISRVIESCVTLEQAQVADTLLELFSKQVPKQFAYHEYGGWVTKNGQTVRDLRDQLKEKRSALVWRRDLNECK